MTKRKVLTFCEHIRGLRENAGLPIRKVAAELDIDPSLYGRIERNDRKPTREQIRKLAELFDQSERSLFSEFLSDQIAYQIIEEDGDTKILKVAEQKVNYIKSTKNA